MDGTGPAWWARDCWLWQSLLARCPHPHRPPPLVSPLLSCNRQVRALASGTLGVPEHPNALDIPKHPTALGACPWGRETKGLLSAPVPGPKSLLAFTGGRSPPGAGSRVRRLVTHRERAGRGPSVGHGWAVGSAGTVGRVWVPCNPSLLPRFPAPLQLFHCRVEMKKVDQIGKMVPGVLPEASEPSPPRALPRPLPTLPFAGRRSHPELHKIRLRAADKAPCRNKHGGSGSGLPGSGKNPGSEVAAAGAEVAQPRVPPPGPYPAPGSTGTRG